MRSIRRTGLRMVWLLLATGIAIAATCAITRSYDLKQPSTAKLKKYQANADGDAPNPGSEDALRVAIGKSQSGHAPEMSLAARQRLRDVEPLLANLGPLQSVDYLGGDTTSDVYQTTFQKGSLVWRIASRGRAIEGLRVTAPQGPTPQDWIDSYTLTQSGKDAGRMILAFAKFLAVVGLGRLAGLRL